MADKYIINKEDLSSVADSIRAKTKTTDEILFPNEFVSAINTINDLPEAEKAAFGDDDLPEEEMVDESSVSVRNTDGKQFYYYGYKFTAVESFNIVGFKWAYSGIYWSCKLTIIDSSNNVLFQQDSFIYPSDETEIWTEYRFDEPIRIRAGETYFVYNQNRNYPSYMIIQEHSAKMRDIIGIRVTYDTGEISEGGNIAPVNLITTPFTEELPSKYSVQKLTVDNIANEVKRLSEKKGKISLSGMLTKLKELSPSGSSTLAKSIIEGTATELDMDDVKIIRHDAFYGMDSLTKVKFNNATEIGEYAFCLCSNLNTVEFNSVQHIGGGAFEDCSGLTSITIPDSVISIGSFAFNGCTSLSKVYISDLSTWCIIEFGDNPTYYARTLYLKNGEEIEEIKELEIPQGVQYISNGAFVGCENITSVTIPESVINISDWAFGECTNLNSIIIFGNIENIGADAFTECPNLINTNIHIQDIESWCNSDKSYITQISPNNKLYLNEEELTEIVLPNTITSIADNVFYGCNNLTKITIPYEVESIGENTFSNCPNLTIRCYIDSYAFNYAIDNDIPYELIADENGFIISRDGKTLIGYVGDGGDITIPDGVVEIADGAFAGQIFEEGPPEGNTNITSITLPKSVETIGIAAFYYCQNLKNIYVAEENPNFKSVYGILLSKNGKLLIRYPENYAQTEYIIPEGVISIIDGAFAGCDNLVSVTIPDSVTEIQSFAFVDCTNFIIYCYENSYAHEYAENNEIPYVFILDPTPELYFTYSVENDQATITDFDSSYEGDVVIPNALGGYPVTSIGNSAFRDCTSLTSITIPDGVTSIGERAFEYCENLTNITIPDNITSIGDYTFSDCTSLTNITIPDNVTSIGAAAFYGCESLTSINIPDSVTSIDGSAFRNCSSLTSINIPDSITSISGGTFQGCESLTSINIPDSVTSIGNAAFYYCKSLTNITIPDGVTSISNNTFYQCKSLTDITIPNGVTSIGNYAFYDCDNLTNITIPNGVTSIGGNTFYGCNSLTSISIPNSVTSIGNYAFYRCSNLASVIIHDSATSIGNNTFNGCENLTSITTGNNVTSIGDKAFYECTNLTNITIPDSVTSIGDSAFYNCKKLTSITIPFIGKTKDGTENTRFRYIFGDDVPSSLKKVVITGGSIINSQTFIGCSFLTSITIPDSMTSIDSRAFYGFPFLTNITISENNTIYKSMDGILFTKDGKTLIRYPAGKKDTTYTIPDGVTSIDGYAFVSCDNLTDITIPDSVTSIGSETFRYCTSLTSVTIPDSVTSIGDYAFDGCENLTIYCYEDSYAHTYATNNSLNYQLIE